MSSRVAATAIIYPGVILGENSVIEDFCIVGAPFKGQHGEKTIIGANAVIRSHSVIYAGNMIGDNFQTGNKANIRELNSIGNNVSIGTLSVVEHHVIIGNGVRIHSQAFIPEFTELQDDCWVGPNVVMTNARIPNTPDAKKQLKGPVVKIGATIGANSTILPGVVVGKESLIGAGTIVTGDVADNVVFVGTPGRVTKPYRKIYTQDKKAE